MCLFTWGDWSDGIACNNCGVTYKDQKTVWDNLEDIYLSIVPYSLRPKNLWYSFKCRVWKRYTTVKPRTLDHTWCDRSHLIFHIVFEVAQRFLEEEGSKTQDEWDWQKEHNPGFYEAWFEAKQICDWWFNEYDDGYVYGLSDEEFDKQYPWTQPADYTGDNYRVLARYNAEGIYEQMMLDKAKRLLDLSPYFWT